MDELRGDNATLMWDGLSTVGLRYRLNVVKDKSLLTRQLLKALGERTVPTEALRGVELTLPADGEPQIRLLLRENADPLLTVAGGELERLFDPYRFYYSKQQELLAEFYAQDIESAIRLQMVPGTQAAERFLIPPPNTPAKLKGFDGTATLDDGQLTFTWSWSATQAKKTEGKHRSVPLSAIETVRWQPMNNGLGHLRVQLVGTEADRVPPADDPHALLLGATHQVPGCRGSTGSAVERTLNMQVSAPGADLNGRTRTRRGPRTDRSRTGAASRPDGSWRTDV